MNLQDTVVSLLFIHTHRVTCNAAHQTVQAVRTVSRTNALLLLLLHREQENTQQTMYTTTKRKAIRIKRPLC